MLMHLECIELDYHENAFYKSWMHFLDLLIAKTLNFRENEFYNELSLDQGFGRRAVVRFELKIVVESWRSLDQIHLSMGLVGGLSTRMLDVSLSGWLGFFEWVEWTQQWTPPDWFGTLMMGKGVGWWKSCYFGSSIVYKQEGFLELLGSSNPLEIEVDCRRKDDKIQIFGKTMIWPLGDRDSYIACESI